MEAAVGCTEFSWFRNTPRTGSVVQRDKINCFNACFKHKNLRLRTLSDSAEFFLWSIFLPQKKNKLAFSHRSNRKCYLTDFNTIHITLLCVKLQLINKCQIILSSFTSLSKKTNSFQTAAPCVTHSKRHVKTLVSNLKKANSF